jgi:hypothetical protein
MNMNRLFVDFNTLTSAPVGMVKYMQEDGHPPPQRGERVSLYGADGLEVGAISMPFVTARGERVLLAEPDEATWRDTVPPEIPLPPVEAQWLIIFVALDSAYQAVRCAQNLSSAKPRKRCLAHVCGGLDR